MLLLNMALPTSKKLKGTENAHQKRPAMDIPFKSGITKQVPRRFLKVTHKETKIISNCSLALLLGRPSFLHFGMQSSPRNTSSWPWTTMQGWMQVLAKLPPSELTQDVPLLSMHL